MQHCSVSNLFSLGVDYVSLLIIRGKHPNSLQSVVVDGIFLLN